jgi:hypothetical protein
MYCSSHVNYETSSSALGGLHLQALVALPLAFISVSPGMEPGFVVFPSHKNNVQFIVGRTCSGQKKPEYS